MSRRDFPGVRRSNRTSHALYHSLDENALLPHIIALAEEQLQRDRRSTKSMRVNNENHGYGLRKRKSFRMREEDFEYSEMEEYMPVKQRKRRMISDEDEKGIDRSHLRRSKRNRVVSEGGDADEVDEEPAALPKDDEVGSGNEVENKSSEKENEEDSSFNSPISARKRPGRPRGCKPEDELEVENGNVKEVETATAIEQEPDEEEPESESDNDEVGARTYSLRRNRPQQGALAENRVIQNSRTDVFRRRNFRRSVRDDRESRRRIPRRSSTTDSSDIELGDAKRDAKDEADFQRRQFRSMFQNRQQLMPVNISGKDLTDSQAIFQQRRRALVANGSTDIDPMGIDKDIGFDKVGGLTMHLQSLKETVLFPMLYPELFESFKIAPPKGMLFYGPPGTGKTLVARALANECSRGDRKVAFFMRKGADCLSKWIGESERQLRLLFDQAYTMRPSIIFFDEIDGLAPIRSSKQEQIHSSIVSTLLALMDGLDTRGDVIVIGATNRLDSIDPALRRPGRFDRELRFSLPDKTARLSILNIHTEKWSTDSRPSPEELDWLAECTSGYCGADLRSLCTEAVLVAIRNKYPHIYLSKEKLQVDPNLVKIERGHFATAIRTIVPACRRDVSIVSKQIHPRLRCLLAPVVEEIFADYVPKGYLKTQNVDNLYSTDLERVVRALEIPPSVPASRFVIYGDGNQGQTHYFLPVIANRLDHLVMSSISCASLFSSANPEESLVEMIQSVIRATANGTPAVLMLPDLDVLQESLAPASWNMLVSRLESFVGFTSLLMIATTRKSCEEWSNDISELFPSTSTFEITPPMLEQRKEYFEQILQAAHVPPSTFNAADYPEPPKAVQTEAIRKLAPEELKTLEENYEATRRHFRIFLREVVGRLIRDRRFNIFNLPVDKEEVEDYYEVIQNPLCLTEMMTKVNGNKYACKDEFMADIRLIRDNAVEYNPERSMHDRMIRNAAFGLVDAAEAIFEADMDEDFERKLVEAAKLIAEAKNPTKTVVAVEKEEANGAQIRVSKTFKGRRSKKGRRRVSEKTTEKPEEVVEVEEEPDGNSMDRDDSQDAQEPEEGETGEPKSPQTVQMEAVSSDPHSEAKDESVSDTLVSSESSVDKSESAAMEVEPNSPPNAFVLDQEAMTSVLKLVVLKTEGWSVPQLETLGAALTQQIDRFSGDLDRSLLPNALRHTMARFDV